MFTLINRGELPPTTEHEIENFNSRLKALWLTEHNEDGTHQDVTANNVIVEESVTVTGDIVSEGDGSFAGNVEALSGGESPITMGYVDVSDTPGEVRYAGWRVALENVGAWAASVSSSLFSGVSGLMFYDASNYDATTGGVWGFRRKSAVSAVPAEYGIVPAPLTASLRVYLGEDATGFRFYEVNGQTIKASTGYFEQGRPDGLGKRFSRAFSAGNYTADTGSWTVASGDVITESFSLVGDTLTFQFYYQTTTTAGTPLYLKIALPNGYTAARTTFVTAELFQGGTWTRGCAYIEQGQTFVRIYRDTVGNVPQFAGTLWPNETDTIWVNGQLSIFIG